MAIEGENSKAKFNTIFIWLFAIIIGIVIGSTFSSDIPFIGNKEIKELERKNQELLEDNAQKDKNILSLRTQHDSLVSNNTELKEIVVLRDSSIVLLTAELDSASSIIAEQDTIIINISDETYKDIANIRNMDVDERRSFFAEYFRSRRKN